MQAFSFQINQVVLIENNTVPYLYDFAKITQRKQNQDQAYEYQIKIYKQIQNLQGKSIDTFKIKKINAKSFYFLKQKCSFFAEIAQSFRSIDLQLSKNQVFIENAEKDNNWKRLFKRSVLSLNAKKSVRIRQKFTTININDLFSKQKDKDKFRRKPLNENKFSNISLGVIQQTKANSTRDSINSQNNQIKQKTKPQSNLKLKSKIQTQCNQKIFKKSRPKSKRNPKANSKLKYKKNILNQRKRTIDERYRCLYYFGLEFIASQEKTQKVIHYFQQKSTEYFDQQKQVEGLQNLLDLLKKIIFSLQLEQKNFKDDIDQLQKNLRQKLRRALYSHFIIFIKSVTEKIILIIRIYYLKPILTMKSIIVSLKIWLNLFLNRIKKKTQQFDQLQAQFIQSAEQILNFISLQ